MELEIQRVISESKREIQVIVVKLRSKNVFKLNRVKLLIIGIYSMTQKVIQKHLSVEIPFNQGEERPLVVYMS